MRIAVLCAALSAAGALVTGCSVGQESAPGATQLTPINPANRAGGNTSAKPTSPKPTSPKQTPPQPTSSSRAEPAPPAGSAAPAAISWVEQGPPVDAADFQVALRAGTTTRLDQDVAFTTPSGISCMTEVKNPAAGLACLVDLADPPRQPPDTYGVWKGGWVDFDGVTVKVGSGHGDPGRFAAGRGTPLPAGRSLSFGDFRCRADTTSLVCANYAHQSAVRYSADGVAAYGCARQTPPATGVGIEYRC